MELFAGFLIVIEFTIIFIFLTFLFFLNTENNILKSNLYYSYFYLYFFFFLSVSLLLNYLFFYFYLNFNSNTFILENYFETLNNYNINDFISIFLNYYNFNLILFLIICFLLLLGSVICVNLNRISYYFKSFELFEKKKSLFLFKNFFFFRRQNLTSQANSNQVVRLIKKK